MMPTPAGVVLPASGVTVAYPMVSAPEPAVAAAKPPRLGMENGKAVTVTILVRLKLAGVATPAADAVTTKLPAMPLAVNVGAFASPLLLVGMLTVVTPPVKVPLAPMVGALKVTLNPGMPLPKRSFTV